MATFQIKHGGNIRKSFTVASAETTNWLKGRVLTINASAQLIVHPGNNGKLVGVAMENRVTTGTGPTTSVTKTGAPTGDRYSVILDPAVFKTSELTSGSAFVAGDVVFLGTDGRYAASAQSISGTSGMKVGLALGDAHANDSARPLELFFNVDY